MGTFTDNLLKLTDFPFSYSFIGLLALIFGQGLSFGDEEFFERLGPLLILMGFVATTLSICDPIGRLQKYLLIGFSPTRRDVGRLSREILKGSKGLQRFASWRNMLHSIISPTGYNKAFSFSMSLYEGLTPDNILEMPVYGDILQRIVPDHVLVSLHPEFPKIFDKSPSISADTRIARQGSLKEDIMRRLRREFGARRFFELADKDTHYPIAYSILSLQDRTVKTTWLVREIDKITSMIYFLIVIFTFFLAQFLVPGFLDKFLVTFQGSNQTESSIGTTTVGGDTNATSGPSFNSNAIAQGSLQSRVIIIVFSLVALVAVFYMLFVHLRELRSKALTTFKFLVELDAIKIDKGDFDKNLQEIEQYLTNGDWTLAEFWVNRTMLRYQEVVAKNLDKKDDYRGGGIY
jgi:hypothetical protein